MKRTMFALGLLAGTCFVPLGIGAEESVAGLAVFQDLAEMTRRLPNLQSRPYQNLMREGIYQPDTLIFKDVETGTELWSLTREACTELANIERRSPWNANGSRIALIGNRRFINAKGELEGGRWAGHNYLMAGDLTNHRKLWVSRDGELVGMTGKFNIWDQKDPNVLYYAVNDTLWKVTVGEGYRDTTAQPLFKFPNDRRKILQEVADTNVLLVQDVNATKPDDPMPLFYVIDLSKATSDPQFSRSHTLSYGGITAVEGHDPANEYHVHSISIARDGSRISWGYGPMESVGEYVGFSVPADSLNAQPTPWNEKMDRWGQYMSHGSEAPDGKVAYFAGPSDKIPTKGSWGLWVRPPGNGPPIWTGASCPGGHVTWVGHDPDWFFAFVSRHPTWQEKRYLGRIVRAKADGSDVSVICNPYDRRRGGEAGYDGIPRPIQSPDATKCWFHSSMLMPNDTFTGSYIAVNRRPYAPTKVELVPGTQRVELQWTPHPVSCEVRGYHVYRSEAAAESFTSLTDKPVQGTRASDRTAAADKTYLYIVTAQEWSGLESDVSSTPLRVTISTGGLSAQSAGNPLKGWDKTPPPPLTKAAAHPDEEGNYHLTWDASPATDLRYYNIYYSGKGQPRAEQQYRIASPPASSTAYIDWGIPEGDQPAYAVTAVDRQGNESTPTPVALEK